MYADETVIYATDPIPENSIKGCQSLLSILVEWYKLNKLTINLSKTKHMIVPRTQTHADLLKDKNVSIALANLHTVTSYKYLGVDVEQTLCFDTMVDTMYNKLKANRKLNSLKNICPYITNSVASLIYKTCIRPVMEYADFLVDSCNKYTTKKLDRIQKRALRIIDQARHKDSTYEDLLVLYHIEDLGLRRRRHHLSVMYRQAHDQTNLDTHRPETGLRSNSKIRFRNRVTQLTKVKKKTLLQRCNSLGPTSSCSAACNH